MTLIEVLIALFVFSVGVLAIALMLGNAIRYSASARFMTEATEIAQYKMESLLNAPYYHNELDEALSPYGPVALGNYNISWKVKDDLPMARMKTINLTVSWNDWGGTKRVVVTSIKQ